MFKLNFKIALRNLLKHKMGALINITGLTVGLAASLILMLYVAYEWNYDRQFKNSDKIYKLMVNFHENKAITASVEQIPDAVAGALKQEMPEVEHIARMVWPGSRIVANSQNVLKIKGRYVDPELLKIFNYEYISGNEEALNEPNSIMLTETAAIKLFGSTNVLNKIVKFENQVDLKVTAVVKDPPANVTLSFECLNSWSLFQQLNDWARTPQWSNYSFTTLLTLKEGTDPVKFNQKIKEFITKHSNNEDIESTLFVYSFTDAHLYGEFKNGKAVGGQIEQIRLFMALGFGILLLASINFMNLSTARAQRRAREVAIKKTVGASRGSLVMQFLAESSILTFIGFLAAIILVELTLPKFNNLLNISLELDYANPVNWLMVLALLLFTTFLAGSYPAFLLSSFNPVQAFRKSVQGGKTSLNIRQLLVVIQFSFAVVLMVSTIVIYRQLQYIKNKPMGFEKNLLVEMPLKGKLGDKFDLFKERLLNSGAITSVSRASASISNRSWMTSGLKWPGMQESGRKMSFDEISTSYDFLTTNGIKLIAGRDFSKQYASDSAAVMLNKTAVNKMNLKEPVGQKIVHNNITRTVIGVFDDIVWGSPNQLESPMILTFSAGGTPNMSMRLNNGRSIKENIDQITKITAELNPGFPVDIRFVDELVEQKFNNEKILSVMSNVFGGLAIFISCMGLLALSAFSAEQRTKEIGVRKVLGATISGIIGMLSLNFIKTVLVALFIGMPIAWFLMDKWLVKFDYHVPLHADIFILTAVSTISIALITVSWQAYRAARTNPVEALKYE